MFDVDADDEPDGFATESLPLGDLQGDAVSIDPEGRIKNSTKATTLVSELATALGMIRKTISEAIAHQPSELVGVTAQDWMVLQELYKQGAHLALFHKSFENGRRFATSEIALRHRQPGIVEWCGPRKLRGEGAIPADLRVDEVFLVSCKYDSKNLMNSSPARLFDNRLKDTRHGGTSWYQEVSPSEYQNYYQAVRTHFGLHDLPELVTALGKEHRPALAGVLNRELPSELSTQQADFCAAISKATASRWQAALGSNPVQRAEFAMSLLRIPHAIYFLLGQSGDTPLRFKVLSRWDWDSRYRVKSFKVTSTTAKQPTVNWELLLEDRLEGEKRVAAGHVEIRWSHGRFNGSPEAKVYLDSPLSSTPGYISL